MLKFYPWVEYVKTIIALMERQVGAKNDQIVIYSSQKWVENVLRE